MREVFRLAGAMRSHPDVERWLAQHEHQPGQLARQWFAHLRARGDDVTEVLHDGQPTACVDDVAFAYVDAFKAHANLGFFQGAALPDPAGLLQGTGRYMRHVKLWPGEALDVVALQALVQAAYEDVRSRQG